MVLDTKIATRQSYGEALAKLGEENENVVVLDADLSGATKTSIFAKKFPERFFDIGIAEQDMIGTAVGLSTFGKIPFASTFAMFAAGRAYDQIRNTVAHTNANVKICATHAGITVGEDGATHQMLEDIGMMRIAEALKAQEALKEKGINVRVIDIHTIKPIDKELIVKCAKETKKIITIEDHNIIGGLGSAVCEVLTEECPVKVVRMGIKDTFGESGKAEELMKHFKIDSESIVEEIIK